MALKSEINIDTIHEHSKRVRIAYKTCIALIIAGVCILLIQLWVRSSSEDLMDDIISDSSEMIAPQYRGKTEGGQEFLITSEKAKELDDGQVLLSSPVANLFEDEDWSNFVLDAMSGIYNDKEKTLTLVEDVELDDDDGNRLKASEIKVDLEKNTISSDNKIDLSGKIGKINADGLEIKEGGDIIIFKGKAKMIINTQIEEHNDK